MIFKNLLTIFFIFGLHLNTFSQGMDPHQQADLLLLEGKYEEAAVLCRQILASDSTDAGAWARLGMALEEMVDYRGAGEAYARALQTDSTNLQYLSLSARNHASLGRYNEAVAGYERIRSLDAGNRNARNQLIRLYQTVNRCDSALLLIQDFLDTDSLNFWYHKQQGNCLVRMNRDDWAAQAYQKALELNQGDYSLYPTLGNILLRLRDWDGAIEWSDRALALDSTYITMIKLKAYALLLNSEFDSSASGFLKAVALGDTSLFTLKFLGLAYYQNHLTGQAVPWLQKAFEKDSLDAETAFHLGVSLGRSYYKEEAIPMLEYTWRLIQPDSGLVSDIYQELAYNHYFLKNYEQVLANYEKALKMTPEEGKIYFEVAYTWDYALNDKRKAIEHYEKFLEAIAYVHQEEEELSRQTGTISMGAQAYYRIRKLKEDLHFEGGK